jgi:hypothetical protein
MAFASLGSVLKSAWVLRLLRPSSRQDTRAALDEMPCGEEQCLIWYTKLSSLEGEASLSENRISATLIA